jgi:hypothetical protein
LLFAAVCWQLLLTLLLLLLTLLLLIGKGRAEKESFWWR